MYRFVVTSSIEYTLRVPTWEQSNDNGALACVSENLLVVVFGLAQRDG